MNMMRRSFTYNFQKVIGDRLPLHERSEVYSRGVRKNVAAEACVTVTSIKYCHLDDFMEKRYPTLTLRKELHDKIMMLYHMEKL